MDQTENQETILVVDDESLIRWHASDLLAQNGYTVLEAADAAAALEVLGKRPDVRLVFTDIQMPGARDGLDLAQLVHENWPDILLLVTSAGVEVANEDLPDHGMFLSKPYRDEEVVDCVKEQIAQSTTRRK